MNTPLTALTAPRRLRRAAAALLAAAVVTVGATACEPTGCQLDCISSVALNPGATTAKVTTTVGTNVMLQVFSDSAMTKLVGAVSSSTGATTHSVSTGQLASATTYWWKVTATDANDVTRVETGSVKTFRREVAVTIKRIRLIDDSDSFGDGEVDFDLKVNADVFTDVYVNDDMATGTDLTNLSITRTATNTPAGLTIKVQGNDDDCDAGLCTGGSYPSFNSGTNSDADWATATFGPTTLPASDGTGTWSAKTTGYAFKFEVSGTWKVTCKAL
jgi:hypothetical protein